MSIAEGVDVEDIKVGGSEKKVLDEGCEHVPWIEEQERNYEPKNVG